MGLFRKSTSSSVASGTVPATDAQLREIGRLVDAGDLDGAERIVQSTSDPDGAAFAAFRYIGLADE
jgi:hypothetical protein